MVMCLFQLFCITGADLKDLLNNVLAEFIALGLIVLASWIIASAGRRRLLAFLGITKPRRLVINVSDLLVMAGGSVGQGNVTRSYQGDAVPIGELQAAYGFRDALNYLIPGLSEQPGLWSKLLLSDVAVDVIPARPGLLPDQQSPVITTGSPGYNSVSMWVEHNLNPIAHFQAQNTEIVVAGTLYKATANFAFVQRVFEPNSSRSIFYTAGFSESGTMGAIFHLRQNWKALYEEYGGTSTFCLLLDVDMKDYTKSSIIRKERR